MKATYIKYSDTQSFSPTVIAYLAHDPNLQPFISKFPSIENFGKLIQHKRPIQSRDLLVQTLKKQYSQLDGKHSAKVLANIDLLKQENTFTVTTGHQLNIFTGPLYFIYKIVTAINLAKELKESFTDKNFVPVYWMATEDHDFEEINHVTILGKKISWKQKASGATGQLNTASFTETLKEYQKVLGISENAEKLSQLMSEAYLKHENLADATRYLVNSLFSEWGLIIIDANTPELKRQFAPIVEQDILEQNSFKNTVETSKELHQQGFNTQVNAREINFFYMKEDLRERIVFENGLYVVLNTDIRFTQKELSEEIKTHPERFSPNVIMRPLYQECILPNLAYVGGGAELVYWLQLKKNFDCYKIDFPILLLRNSALITFQEFSTKLSRLHLSPQEIFKSTEELKKEWVLSHSNNTLNLLQEWEELELVFEKIRQRTNRIDSTLNASAEAVKARLNRAFQNLEKKMIKAEKKNFGDILQQIENIKSKYFPGDGLQERSENFGSFYLKFGESFINELICHFKPLDGTFTIIEP